MLELSQLKNFDRCRHKAFNWYNSDSS